MQKWIVKCLVLAAASVFFLLQVSPVQAVDLDNGKCVDFYLIYEQKCDLAIEKIKVSNQFGDCNAAGVPDSFKTQIKPKIDVVLTKYFNKDTKPTTIECLEMYGFFYAYNNSLYDSAGSDTQKCMLELLTCGNLLQSCQNNTGQVKLNDLENQCKEFLKGGAVTWDSLKGKNACSDATKLKGTVEEQCAKYKEDIKKEKAYTPPPRDFMFTEDTEAVRAAQKGKIEGLAKSTFHLIGDRTPAQVFGGFIKAIMGILGSIALGMFVYGGFLIMGGGGNAENIGKGTQIVIWSALGVVVIFASYTLVQFVLDII